MMSDVILMKLESLNRIVVRLQAYQGITASQLVSDVDKQDIIMLNLERAVQVSTDIATIWCSRMLKQTPTSGGDAYQILARENVLGAELAEHMRKSVGFRNLAVHEYTKIDYEVVSFLVNHRLADFREFARTILNALPHPSHA